MTRRPFVRAIQWPFLVLLLLGAAARPARAVEERAWASLELSGTFYDPEQGLRDKYGFGARAAGFVNRWAGVEGLFHHSSPDLESPATGTGTFTHYGVGVILTPDRYRWTLPYIYGGIGQAKSKRDDLTASTSRSAFHFGGGVIVRLGEMFGFRMDGRDITYTQEGGPGRDTRVNTILVSGAFTGLFAGRPRDTDADGVPDRRDRCVDTPPGAVVDASGCPLDTDGDGVFDGLDKCPGTPKGAKVDASGCPIDSDKDGVADGIDTCPDTPAGVLVDAKGCSMDSDKDGVPDGPDKCPNTPAGAMVDASGCPIDSDGDGVPDGIDVCPATPSGVPVNAGGCPLVSSPYERQMLQDWMIRLTDLAFVPDSSRLLPAGMATLDSVAVVLRQWPMLKIEIGAHVDDAVPAGYRVPLSTQQAQAVARYILQSSPTLDPKNFSLTGYGSTDPIVSGRNAASRRRNRRIEFKVVNPNVLSQEQQRRASFGTTPYTPGAQPAPAPGGEAPP
ncbi:MAG: thrombospondin type 3 repeat-containing protein, partial [Bacteroidota bacterium]